MQFDYEVRGTNRVRNQLRTAAAYYPNKADPVIERHVKGQRQKLRTKPYPPMLPNQVYRRTGNLANRWAARRDKPGVWRVTNSATYAVWVIKRGMQNRKYHLGRWWTAEDELEKDMSKLTKALSVELEQLMDKQRD